jgi:hypothetical protein
MEALRQAQGERVGRDPILDASSRRRESFNPFVA